MAVTLTVTSIQPLGNLMLITVNRSDNNQSEQIYVDISKAPSVMTALAIATAAIQNQSAIINAAITNSTSLTTLIGQSF